MRGVGRFDQRGSIGDALKQGVGTYAGGKLFNKGMTSAGFRDAGASGYKEFLNQGTKDSIGGFFKGTEATQATDNALSKGNAGAKKFAEDQGKGFMERTTDKLFSKVPFGEKLNQTVKEKLLVGGATGVAKYLYGELIGGYPEPKPGEDMAAYIEERRQRVGKQMKTYMDNYLAYDPEYSAMSEEQKNAFVERNNKNMGGLMRQNYQTGGISMSNTMAQNRAINDARRAQNQGVFQAARAKLFPEGNFQQIKTNAPTQKDYNIGVTADLVKQLPGGAVRDVLAPAAAATLSVPYDVIQGIGRAVDQSDVDTSPYAGIIDDTEIPRGPSLSDLGQAIDAENPLSSAVERTIGASAPLAERLSGQNIIDVGSDPLAETTPTPDAGLSQAGVIPGFTRLKNPDGAPGNYNEFMYKGPDGQIYGAQTYSSIAAGQYPDMYDPNKQTLASGGRVGQNMGGLMRLNYMIGGEAKQMEAGAPPIMYSGNMDPNAQAGLPSTPGPIQMAEDGPEFDMREEGGFQPLGRQEGKDDVPAMLAKNEFVMTADAVRAAGGGSIQKGAQKMYDTMKKLESRVS
jgi:hypothetical protein